MADNKIENLSPKPTFDTNTKLFQSEQGFKWKHGIDFHYESNFEFVNEELKEYDPYLENTEISQDAYIAINDPI